MGSHRPMLAPRQAHPGSQRCSFDCSRSTPPSRSVNSPFDCVACQQPASRLGRYAGPQLGGAPRVHARPSGNLRLGPLHCAMPLLLSMPSSLRHHWQGLSPFQQRWLTGIALGVAVEILLIVASVFHVGIVRSAQDWALDSMMRLQAKQVQVQAEPHDQLRRLALVAVDDSTWRDVRWGGGEPAVAPREQLAELVTKAFEAGARQVILDVLIETAREASPQEDQQFAATLQQLLDTKRIDRIHRLILVRSLRQPPDLGVTTVQEAHGALHGRTETGYLPELRQSPAIDKVVAESGGRIVLAAPYFRYSPDRVLRDWELFQTVCERHVSTAGQDAGHIRVVPAVQLVVAAFMVGVDDRALPWTSSRTGQGCLTFPRAQDGRVLALNATELAARHAEGAAPVRQLQATVDGVTAGAWATMRSAFAQSNIEISAGRVSADSLANRVVYRHDSAPLTLSAMEMLQASEPPDLKDYVVVIGQTFPESRDMHLTPIGVMPGAMVLINAIDSMVRHQVVEKPPSWLVWPLTLALLIVVAGLNAKFSANLASISCTVILIVALLPLSYWLFKFGVWLDFALPLLGVLCHTLYEYIKHSGGHGHESHEASGHA